MQFITHLMHSHTNLCCELFFPVGEDDYNAPDDLNLIFNIESINGDVQCLNLEIIDDADYEREHTFNIFIAEIEPPVVMESAEAALVEITDNDSKSLFNALLCTVSLCSSPYTVPTVSLTRDMFTGIEGDSSFDDVCVQATLGPGGVFETPLTVTLIGTAGTASEFYIMLLQ